MSHPKLPERLMKRSPLPSPMCFNPNLNVVVAESEVCGHEILTTFIDDEFVGIYIGKDGQEVFSHLKEANTVQLHRKDR